MSKPRRAVWRRATPLVDGDSGSYDSIISAYPGPALSIADSGEILAANGDAARLALTLREGQADELRLLAASIVVSGRPATGQILLPAGVGGVERAVYHLSGFPVSKTEPQSGIFPKLTEYTSDAALIFARDVSAEHAMRLALVESRDLYRDLSRCSSDFAWQTDENGVFSFVSAKGALGYSATALNGRSSLELIDVSTGLPGAMPFVTRDPVEDVELTMTGAEGEQRYCIVDAVPAYDRQNNWRGARGVCRDVTEARNRQRALDRMREREEQVRAIVDVTHRTLDPHTAFTNAARIIASSTGCPQAAILAMDSNGALSVLGLHRDGSDEAEREGGGPPATPPGAVVEILREFRRGSAGSEIERAHIVVGDWLHWLAGTGHGGAVNGALWMCLPAETGEAAGKSGAPRSLIGSSEERPLADAIAHHIGISIAHTNQLRMLESLSRTDELTGLLNRRAFMDDLRQRHAHRYRVLRPGALLYIDLDNFKPVNDNFGHDAGDKVLREVAALLTFQSRIGDLCARLGGDEFALWLEDTDTSGAEAKARHLLSEVGQLNDILGDEKQGDIAPLGFSIGIAVTAPSVGESLDEIIKRADSAMYQAKHGGKNRYELAGLYIAPTEQIDTETGKR